MTRRIITLTLALVMMLGLFAGCSGNTPASTTAAAATTAAATTAAAAGTTAAAAPDAPAALDEVNLVWWNRTNAFNPADSTPTKLEAGEWLQNYFKEKINANVEYKWYGTSEYDQKTTAAMAAGEQMDVVFTSIGNYLSFPIWSKRNAFADITDLIHEYAEETYTSIPEWVWEAASIKGRLYAMPTYKDVAVWIGQIYNKTMAQELGVEDEFVNSGWSVYKEMDEFLYKVKDLRDKAHPDWSDVPISTWYSTMHAYYEADNLASIAYTSIPGTPSFTDAEFDGGKKVFNVYSTQEYADAIKLVTRWVDDNIVPYDAKEWDKEGEIKNSGKMFMRPSWGTVSVPEDDKISFTEAYADGWKQGYKLPGVAFTYTGYPQAVMQAIAENSQNKERSMMLLNLVFSDPQVSTTLRFGIEGKGWNRVEKNGVTRVDFTGTYNEDPTTRDKEGMYIWYHAEQGNLFTCLLPLNQPDDYFKTMDEANDSAAVSVNMGFVFDVSPVENQIAAVTGVVEEYHNDLILGMTKASDLDARIQAFNEKLNANGAEQIITEAQTQLDAWRAANG